MSFLTSDFLSVCCIILSLTCPFQALEQERHGLHLKLENLEGEYENTVKELQYDISQLREELARNKHETYAGEKDRINRIQDLTQQVRVKYETPHTPYFHGAFPIESDHFGDFK